MKSSQFIILHEEKKNLYISEEFSKKLDNCLINKDFSQKTRDKLESTKCDILKDFIHLYNVNYPRRHNLFKDMSDVYDKVRYYLEICE